MATLPKAVESVLNSTSNKDIEIVIVNDGLDRTTSQLADKYPVKVIDGNGNGPASARNIGVQNSSGEILVFLDADCRVSQDWFKVHLHAHEHYGGLLAVGGAICLEPDAPFWARCDHYCSWYNVHPDQMEAWVPNHPSANLSVSRSTFDRVGSFKENLPTAGVHEETEWQGRLFRLGGRIRFEPRATAWHVDRDDAWGFLKHNYRWGYNSIEVKSGSAVSRFPRLYKNPWILIAGSLPLAFAHTLYTVLCWLKARKLEPLFLSPFLFVGRLAYAGGMTVGGIRSIRRIKRGNRRANNAS